MTDIRIGRKTLLTALRKFFESNSVSAYVRADNTCDVEGDFSLEELADKILSYGKN